MSLFFRITLIILLSGCNSKPKDNFEDSVVKVNENSLTGFEFSQILVRKFTEQELKYPKQEIITILKKQIIEDFIIQSVYDDYARENNILVKKEILDEEFEKFKAGYPDLDSFDVFLNESGQNRESYRLGLKDRITRDLVNSKLLESEDFTIEPKLITEYYNQNTDEFKRPEQINLKQIIFESEEDGIKILELLKKDKTVKFETLANKYSLGPEKENGGELGWLNINSYSAFEEAAKTSKGQITPIIKSENGYHIFKVIDKRKAETLKLTDVSKKIENQLRAKKQSVFIGDWIKEQINNSKVILNKDLINKIVVNRPTNL